MQMAKMESNGIKIFTLYPTPHSKSDQKRYPAYLLLVENAAIDIKKGGGEIFDKYIYVAQRQIIYIWKGSRGGPSWNYRFILDWYWKVVTFAMAVQNIKMQVKKVYRYTEKYW